MASFGLLLLGLALVLISSTGWPTWAVLLGVCTVGAVGAELGQALAGWPFDAAVLGSLPARIVGLLEHDLLQAIALYALVGALLQHLGLADLLYRGLRRGLSRVVPRGASAAAGFVLGALLAPMNGSAGASLLALQGSAGAHWRAEGLAAPRRAALVAVTGTLGVVVPPSLVLLLLGDEMLRSHTTGLGLARDHGLPLAQAGLRIVNTQDLLQACLLPALLLGLGWMAIALLRGDGPRAAATAAPAADPPSRGERWALWAVPAVVVTLLALVAAGRVRAVEAAASAGVLLLAWGLVSGRLPRPALARVLDDAMATTGALFALLVAATTCSLLLRSLGTDRLVADALLSRQGSPLALTATVLALTLAVGFVLDAFEIVFLVVPVVMPPLLAQVGDAAWVATLTLLVLQAGFLLPPFGLAAAMARGREQPLPSAAALWRELGPYLLWLAAVVLLVALWPQTTQWWRSAPPTLNRAEAPDAAEVERLIRQMGEPREPDAPAR